MTDKHSDPTRFHEHNRLCTKGIAQRNRVPAEKMTVAQLFTKFVLVYTSRSLGHVERMEEGRGMHRVVVGKT